MKNRVESDAIFDCLDLFRPLSLAKKFLILSEELSTPPGHSSGALGVRNARSADPLY